MSVHAASRRGVTVPDVTMVIQRLRPLFSGQGVQVEVLARELAARGVRVTILTAGHGPAPAWESIDGYRVRRLRADIPWLSRHLRHGRFRSEIFGLRALLWLLWHGWRTRLIHVHALGDALYTAWGFARFRRLPIVFEMTLLGTDDALSFARSRNRFRRLRNAIFRRCDGYVAISPALAGSFEEAGLPADKLRLIPQSVDTRRFRPVADRATLRRRLRLPVEGPLLVFVGSLIARKGIDILLAAWARIHARISGATLLLVGVDEFPGNRPAARFLADCLATLPESARQRLVMTGVRDDVEDLMGAADLFLFPSRREGFGTVMIEAMACGLPCVVAELAGITDFIFDSEPPCGVIVPQEDPDALARQAIDLLSDRGRAAALSLQARRRAVGRFSVTRIAEDYLDLYGALAASGER